MQKGTPENNNEPYLTETEQRRRKKRLLLLLLLLLLPLLGTGFWIGSLFSNFTRSQHPVQVKIFHAAPLTAVHSTIQPIILPTLKVEKQRRFIPFIMAGASPSRSAVSTVTPAITTPSNTSNVKLPKASGTYIPVSEKAPAGFEYLSEPVDTIVDVFYAGSFVASVSATYTPTTIEFHNPKSFLDKIHNIKNRTLVEKELTGKLPNNSHLICPHQPRPDCGFLKPKIAGVIFNANKFKATLYINQDYLTAAEAPNPFIPSSTAGFSFVSHFYGVTNGINNDSSLANSNSYGFRTVNDMGFKESVFHSEMSYSQDDLTNNDGNISNLHVDQLSAGHYFNSKYLLEGGILDSVGNTFVGNQTYAGMSFGTTLDTLREDSTSFGTPIQVFLSSPSYVSIYRDGRLLASKYYQAGNQMLDTSSLPNGAYQIAIRIRDSQGAVQEETRFFSKSSQIPPMAFPQYYVSTGYIEKNQFDQSQVMPEFGTKEIYQVGYNRRIQSNWGVSSSVVGTDSVALGSGGVFFLGEGYQINPQFLFGSDKEYGAGLDTQASINNFSATLFARQIWAPNKQQINTDITTLDPLAVPTENFLSADQDSEQADLNLGYSFGRVYTSVNGHISKFGNLPLVYSYGPDIRFPIFHQDGTNIDMHLSGARARDDWQVLAQMVVYFTSPQWSTASSVGYQSINDRTGNNSAIEQSSGMVGNINTYWQQLNSAQEGTVLGVNANTEPGRQSVGTSAQYSSTLGGLQANVQHNMGADISSNTQYSASVDTHLAYADQHTAIGGARSSDNTGVIIDIESPTPGDEFQVLVDEQIVQIVKTGHPTPIFLAPFKTYHIRIKAVSQRFYEYSEIPKTITLYRGNFKTLEWHTKQKIIVFAYIETPQGKPLKDTLLHGGVGINATETDGSVQAEVYDDAKQLTARLPDNRQCVITLPVLKEDGSLTVAKKLICRPMTWQEQHEKPKTNTQ